MRIAKAISHRGYCSRRDAEKLILEGKVFVNGEQVLHPASFVTENDDIRVEGIDIKGIKERLWLYHKPIGLITSHKDSRKTVFDDFPVKDAGHIVSVGRLDINSQGLLLMTNSKSLAHHLESPSSGLVRTYKVRFFGKYAQKDLENLANGVTIEGVHYKPIKVRITSASLDRQNQWCEVELIEGKNREIRKVFEYLGLQVNRLIRTKYGPFELGDLPISAIKEVSPRLCQE